MPRGAKIDHEATRSAHFEDPRSFRGLDGHDYLKGADIMLRRWKVYERDLGLCQPCLRKGRKNFVGWDGDLHHKQGGLVGRHDDLSNLEWSCRPCHQREHVQVQWTPKNT